MVKSSALHLDVVHETPDDFHEAQRVSLILKRLQQETPDKLSGNLNELLLKQKRRAIVLIVWS